MKYDGIITADQARQIMIDAEPKAYVQAKEISKEIEILALNRSHNSWTFNSDIAYLICELLKKNGFASKVSARLENELEFTLYVSWYF